MSLRTWLLLALGMLLAQAVLAQEKMGTYDKNNSGARRESVEPPRADGSEPAKPKAEVPKRLPQEIQSKPKPEAENGLLPAQAILPVPTSPRPIVNAIATPIVTIDVVGNENAAEGSEVKYTFVIRNRSEAKAHHVLVRGMVPKNAKFVKAEPPATDPRPKEEQVREAAELHWLIGTLNPREERSIEVFFRPNPEETEIKVLARVQIEHGRWLVTKIAKPDLRVKKTAPKEGILYDAVNYRIEVMNAGKTTLTDVRVEDQLPKDDGMEYERDPKAKIDNEKNQRTWTIPTLAPGERRVFDFTVIAKKTGRKKTLTQVAASGVAPVQEAHEIDILEVKLDMKVTPPPQATVGQPAEIRILVENKGTATLNNLRVNVAHPPDVEVKKATNGSNFFKDGVQWILPKLASGENRELKAQFIAKTPGKRKFTVTAKADRGQEHQDETSVDFEGIPALNWDSKGTPTSSEAGSVNYTVEVYNPGTAHATNVVLRVKLPPELRLETADPPHIPNDGGLTFKPIHIPPKKKATFVISCLAQKKGVATAQFDLLADHLKTSIHNELTTTINARETPKKNDRDDRTTQAVPKNLPMKEPANSEPKGVPIVPVGQPKPDKESEPKKPPETKKEKESEPKKGLDLLEIPGSIAPLVPVDKKGP